MRTYVAALQQGLDKLGWIEGRNIKFDYRWARADADRFPGLAKELVAMQPDLSLRLPTAAVAPKRETMAYRLCS